MNNINDQYIKGMTESTDATPDSLRASAAVLEEKAVELEKITFTEYQKKRIETAQELGINATTLNVGKGTHKPVCSEGDDWYQGGIDFEYEKLIGTNLVHHDGIGLLRFISLVDEDGDYRILLDINY